MANGFEDKRLHQRLEHRANVQLSNGNETIAAYTKDLSEKGLFVIGSFVSEIILGDQLEVLVVDIPDAIPRPVIVKRIVPDVGFGVEFV
jgi:hypothetical protein